MRITKELFRQKQHAFQGAGRTTTYILIEELLQRNYKVEMPFWPARTILFTTESGEARMINGITCWNTPAFSSIISSDKLAAYWMAQKHGLPILSTELYKSPSQAVGFWEKFRGKVILKSTKGFGGTGVWTKFNNPEDYSRQAELKQKTHGTILLQEKSGALVDLRLLYIGGQLCAATARKPSRLSGDGISTISQLVTAENNRRLQANLSHHPTMALAILTDEGVVMRSNKMTSEILKPNETILASLANIANGGVAEDVTKTVHSDFINYGLKLVQAFASPVLAVDFLCDNPTTGFRIGEQQGAFLETNVRPGIDLHQYPHYGNGQYVAKAFIDYVIKNCRR